MPKQTFTYTYEKSTKNRHVYKNTDAPVDTLYVDRNFLRQPGKEHPETITVTMEW